MRPPGEDYFVNKLRPAKYKSIVVILSRDMLLTYMCRPYRLPLLASFNKSVASNVTVTFVTRGTRLDSVRCRDTQRDH